MFDSNISCHAFDADLIKIIAKEIADNHRQQFPFLQNIIILLPNYHRAADLQQQLLIEFTKKSHNSPNAMLSPQIFAFRDYIDKTTLINKEPIPKNARELILIDALQQHKNLFGNKNLLTTAYALLELFDELTRKQLTLPENIHDFITLLQQAYEYPNDQQEALGNEAKIVHTLWIAWHQQLDEMNRLDSETLYHLKLTKNLQNDNNHIFYVAGFFDFLPAEIQWLNFHLNRNSLKLFFQIDSTTFDNNHYLRNMFSEFGITASFHHSNTNNSLVFQTIFDHQTSHLQVRAKNAGENLKSIKTTLNTFQAMSFEEEAQAITIQIRLWLKNGKNNLALILEDRRLARRIRALLQRDGIGMSDSSGWALSTTSAASVLESWLQCIEENFHHAPLLDILKSPFAFEQTDNHTLNVFRFEQDLVFHENITRDLSRYKQSWISRQKRLNISPDSSDSDLIELIEHLSLSAIDILSIHKKPAANLSEYLTALISSLTQLNAHQRLMQDDAGKLILALLDKLKKSASFSDISIDWITFRHWLGLKLEENNFSPTTPFKKIVELLHLSQVSLGRYDGVIIGGMTKDQFPGATKQTPFFNQSVRQELGLNTASQQRHIKYCFFRYLLESSPSILLSYHSGPQESLPGPWLELISRFHFLAFSEELESTALHDILKQMNATPLTKNNLEINSQLPNNYQALIPVSVSASAHQTLIHCPYAFFAGNLLKLRAEDVVSEKLAKSDYGERIHLCLQAFHAGGINNLAGPFREKIDSENKTKAIKFLTQISKQVFAFDLEDNFQHRGWLNRWQKIIPAYIDWQILHEQNWQFKSGEIQTSAPLDSNIKLHGRIDRIDQSSENISIIDYKTGSVPRSQEVENGEAVQLAHYAMSNPEKVTRVEYLQFESGQKDVAEKCTIENENLDELLAQTRQRLSTIFKALKSDVELPPWGNEKICQFCQFNGLCRHKFT